MGNHYYRIPLDTFVHIDCKLLGSMMDNLRILHLCNILALGISYNDRIPDTKVRLGCILLDSLLDNMGPSVYKNLP